MYFNRRQGFNDTQSFYINDLNKKILILGIQWYDLADDVFTRHSFTINHDIVTFSSLLALPYRKLCGH